MTERRALPYPWDRVKEALQARLPDLMADLGIRGLPNEPDAQGLVHPLNPNRNDRRPGSLIVWTKGGSGVGSWKDFASDDKGDIFDMIQFWARPRPAEKIDVYWWALDWLGWKRDGEGTIRTLAQDRADRERRERERRAEESRQVAEDAARGRALFRLWLGLPHYVGTPAERYLKEARRIPLDRLSHPPGAIRWAEHVEFADPVTGEVTEWRHCMVTAMTRGKAVTGLHRTFLKPDGSAKAGRKKDKTMIGSVRGAAIRLSPGPSGLSPTKAAAQGVTGPLALGEGIETCLPVACVRPDYRVWAAGSLSLMGLIDWPSCASAIVLLRDNDWGKPEAQAQFDRVEKHFRRQAEGRLVVVAAPPPELDDFSTWARVLA